MPIVFLVNAMFEALVPYWEIAKPYVVGTIKGFGAGAFAAGLGYLKNKGDFDGKKFTRTVIVGGVVGALGEGFGVSVDTAEEWLAYPFVVYAIDVVTKAIWRRALQPVLSRVWTELTK